MKPKYPRYSWIMVLAVAALCWCGTTQNASAVDDEPTRKLGRGCTNIFLCFVEVPKSWKQVSDEQGGIAGITWGTFKGVTRTFMRAGVGVYEVVTFPYANGPIIYPEWVVANDEEENPWRVRQQDEID